MTSSDVGYLTLSGLLTLMKPLCTADEDHIIISARIHILMAFVCFISLANATVFPDSHWTTDGKVKLTMHYHEISIRLYYRVASISLSL